MRLKTSHVQYDQHSNALISEYYDGFRTTSFKRKVRPSHCLQSANASFSQHTDLSMETATENGVNGEDCMDKTKQ